MVAPPNAEAFSAAEAVWGEGHPPDQSPRTTCAGDVISLDTTSKIAPPMVTSLV